MWAGNEIIYRVWHLMKLQVRRKYARNEMKIMACASSSGTTRKSAAAAAAKIIGEQGCCALSSETGDKPVGWRHPWGSYGPQRLIAARRAHGCF